MSVYIFFFNESNMIYYWLRTSQSMFHLSTDIDKELSFTNLIYEWCGRDGILQQKTDIPKKKILSYDIGIGVYKLIFLLEIKCDKLLEGRATVSKKKKKSISLNLYYLKKHTEFII